MNMRAAIFKEPHQPLELVHIPEPKCQSGELLVQVEVCGVCRTDLHVFEGEVQVKKSPIILGHEIVGKIIRTGSGVTRFQIGDRVGIPWLSSTCGICEYCRKGKENLCDAAEFTGIDRDGGYAEYTTCRADFAIPLEPNTDPLLIAPLLCAGLIGYRSYRKIFAGNKIGFYGFGAAAHLLLQLAQWEGKQVYAFTREGDFATQKLAKEMGAVWAGSSQERPPELLDAALLFAPVGELVPLSLKVLKKGGQCICGGIHMTNIPSFPYRDLWGERSIESVANLTRQDAQEFLDVLRKVTIQPNVTVYPLEKINQALDDLKHGRFRGAAVVQF